MPSWGELLADINDQAQAHGGLVNLDDMRGAHLRRVQECTDNDVVLYATDFLGSAGGIQTAINLQDLQGFMEVMRGLKGPGLDLILHTPGGQAEATERIVRYIRSKFSTLRVIVLFAAMSAGTMWAMAADEIIMGKHSQLGPIDPQVTLGNSLQMPAGALIEQFKGAIDECAQSPERITGWLPTLQQYPPGLLNFCESATQLSKKLVTEWLGQYMLKDNSDEAERAAEWLANDKEHLSHSRPITREQLIDHGIRVTALEDNQDLQDAVLSVFHMATHTFTMSTAVKIIENHMGRRYVQHGGQMVLQQVPQGIPPQGAPPQGLLGELQPRP